VGFKAAIRRLFEDYSKTRGLYSQELANRCSPQSSRAPTKCAAWRARARLANPQSGLGECRRPCRQKQKSARAKTCARASDIEVFPGNPFSPAIGWLAGPPGAASLSVGGGGGARLGRVLRAVVRRCAAGVSALIMFATGDFFQLFVGQLFLVFAWVTHRFLILQVFCFCRADFLFCAVEKD
jgi:hypothetical protein